MRKLLIIGAGGHGQVVAEIASDLGYDLIDFLDDNSLSAIGRIDDLEKYISYEEALCGIGNNRFRQNIIRRLLTAGYQIPALIHPTAYVSRTATIKISSVVEPKAVVNAHSVIGEGSIISVGSIVDHDVVIGKCCHVNSGAIVKAGDKLVDFTKLEAGEVVLEYESAVVKKN